MTGNKVVYSFDDSDLILPSNVGSNFSYGRCCNFYLLFILQILSDFEVLDYLIFFSFHGCFQVISVEFRLAGYVQLKFLGRGLEEELGAPMVLRNPRFFWWVREFDV